MLADVEIIAQKAETLKEFADTKYVKKPSKTNLDPSHFTRKKGEPADSRRKTRMEAEQNVVTTIALYLAMMGFCQKGINELNRYSEEHIDGPKEPEGAEVSPGVNDAIMWFKDTFKSCFERSEDMKAWLPDGHKTAHTFIDRVIYDHALALMQDAASKELLEENFPLVQKEYEKALWMMYAIADDVIQEGNPFSEQDVETIGGFIETTKTRLMRLKRRMETEGLLEPDTPSIFQSTIIRAPSNF